MFRATINHCISVYAVTVIGLGNVYRLSYDNVDSELLQWVMISLCGRYWLTFYLLPFEPIHNNNPLLLFTVVTAASPCHSNKPTTYAFRWEKLPHHIREKANQQLPQHIPQLSFASRFLHARLCPVTVTTQPLALIAVMPDNRHFTHKSFLDGSREEFRQLNSIEHQNKKPLLTLGLHSTTNLNWTQSEKLNNIRQSWCSASEMLPVGYEAGTKTEITETWLVVSRH